MYGLNRTQSEKSEDEYATKGMEKRAIVIEDNSVTISPKNMTLGEYYPAVLNGQLFLYKRTGNTNIEVYELNDTN
jgi:hypothetical protein